MVFSSQNAASSCLLPTSFSRRFEPLSPTTTDVLEADDSKSIRSINSSTLHSEQNDMLESDESDEFAMAPGTVSLEPQSEKKQTGQEVGEGRRD